MPVLEYENPSTGDEARRAKRMVWRRLAGTSALPAALFLACGVAAVVVSQKRIAEGSRESLILAVWLLGGWYVGRRIAHSRSKPASKVLQYLSAGTAVVFAGFVAFTESSRGISMMNLLEAYGWAGMRQCSLFSHCVLAASIAVFAVTRALEWLICRAPRQTIAGMSELADPTKL